MKIFFAIPVFCLFAGVSAPGDEAPEEKAVSVILLSATSKIPWEPGIKKPERTFQVVLGFSNPGPGKIIGSRKEGIRLEIRDSIGGGTFLPIMLISCMPAIPNSGWKRKIGFPLRTPAG